MEILLFWLPGRVAGPEVGPGRKWQGLGPALSIASAATGWLASERPSLGETRRQRVLLQRILVSCTATAEDSRYQIERTSDSSA